MTTFTDVPLRVVGETWSADDQNLYVRDNLAALISAGINRGFRFLTSKAGSSGSSFSVETLSQKYRSLKVVGMARGAAVAASVDLSLQINDDAGANYSIQSITVGSAVAAAQALLQTSMMLTAIPAASAPTLIPGGFVLDFPGYSLAGMNKSVLGLSYYETSAAAAGVNLRRFFGEWKSTTGINKLTFSISSGAFARYQIYVYGGL